MSQCIKCGLEFGDETPDYCPVCHSICYICPWCGRATDAAQAECSMLDCGRPIKYLRMTPDLRDIMRLRRGEVVELGHAHVKIDRALYASQRVTVYRGADLRTSGGWRSEPKRGESVAVREVVDECSLQTQALIAKLLTLRHPNVVRTYAGAADSERCCYRLLQAWVGEESLATTHLEEEGGSSADNAQTARLTVTLSKAVEHLHSKGILHCDITPFNILLTRDGTPVLSDFGLATLVDDPGSPRGYTPGYAPMEMHPREESGADIAGGTGRVGPWTDRYMLGTTMYSVATGTDGRSIHPVTRTNVLASPADRAKYEAGLGGSPQTPIQTLKPDIDPGLALWIETAMSLSAGDRFKSDQDMVKRAESLSKGIGRKKAARKPKRKWLKRPVKWASAVCLLLLLFFLARHAYTVTHHPANLAVFFVSDLAREIRMPDTSLRILKAAPTQSADIKLAIGRVMEDKGQLDEALAMYQRALSMDPGFGSARRGADRLRDVIGRASLQRGMQLYRSGEYFLAFRQLSKADRCGARSVEGMMALSRIAERRGDISGAAALWERVAELRPSAVRPRYEAALLYLESGKLDKAQESAVRARALHDRRHPSQDVADAALNSMADEIAAALRGAKSMRHHAN